MTNNGEKKSHPVTSWCKLNSILKSSGHENDFMILRLLSKVKLLPEIRIEKVLSVSLFHFFLQLIKHKAQRKKSNLSNYKSKLPANQLRIFLFYIITSGKSTIAPRFWPHDHDHHDHSAFLKELGRNKG